MEAGETDYLAGGYASGWDLIVATRRFNHRAEVALDQSLEEYGISFAQHRMLEVIAGEHQIHVSDVARRLLVTRQTAQAVAEQLYRGDLVDVEREGRVLYLSVSPVGAKRLERQFRPAVQDVAGQIEHETKGSERRRTVLLFRRVEAAVRAPNRPTWWLERPAANVQPPS